MEFKIERPNCSPYSEDIILLTKQYSFGNNPQLILELNIDDCVHSFRLLADDSSETKGVVYDFMVNSFYNDVFADFLNNKITLQTLLFDYTTVTKYVFENNNFKQDEIIKDISIIPEVKYLENLYFKDFTLDDYTKELLELIDKYRHINMYYKQEINNTLKTM